METHRSRKHQHNLLELKAVVKEQEERVKRSVCSVAFFKTAFKTLVLVLFYYIFSIGITFYNRHLFKDSRVALSITMCHLIFKFIAAGCVRILLECKTKEQRVLLDWSTYIKRVAAAGLASSLDIGLSNWSFELLTVSLYSMCKSTSVIFILMFSLLFKLEKFRWNLIIIVLFIAAGLFLFTFRSTQFNLEGFILVTIAAVLSGVRWTVAQILLQKHELGLHNPIDMMYHIQPWMILGLLPLSASIEWNAISTSQNYFGFTEWSQLLHTVLVILPGACLGFMLEYSEFLLVSYTSGLTISIAGIFKELCILALSVLINHDQMNFINAIGLLVCMTGITIHVINKAIARNEEKAEPFLNSTSESMEMLIRERDQNDSESDEVDLFSVDRDR